MRDLHSPSNCWETPPWLFKQLNEEFNFTHDLCATESNHLRDKWFDDYLLADFRDGTGFCNPPYSNPQPFIEKAWEDAKYCRIVCLVKCDPSTRWFAVFYDHDKHEPRPGCQIRFFPKRIKFDPPRQLRDSGEVFLVNNKWVHKCKDCSPGGLLYKNGHNKRITGCQNCNGKEYRPLTGPAFGCALIIMDRRKV